MGGFIGSQEMNRWPPGQPPQIPTATGHGCAALAPVNISPPVISGTPQDGSILTSGGDSWTNIPSDFQFQWWSTGGAQVAATASPGESITVTSISGTAMTTSAIVTLAPGASITSSVSGFPSGITVPSGGTGSTFTITNAGNGSFTGSAAAMASGAVTFTFAGQTFSGLAVPFAQGYITTSGFTGGAAVYNFSTPQAIVSPNAEHVVILSSANDGTQTGGDIQFATSVNGAVFSSFPDLFVSSVTATGSAVTFHFAGQAVAPTVGGFITTSGFTGAGSAYNFSAQQAITASTTSSATISSTANVGSATGEVQLPMTPFVGDDIFVQEVAFNTTNQNNFPGLSKFISSQPVGPITAAGPPDNITPPVISGTPQVGDVLALTQGTWSENPQLVDQWESNGTPISGQTGPTYIPVVGDETKNITVVETATDPLGSANATSNSLGPVTAPVASCSASTAWLSRANVVGGVTTPYQNAVTALICGQVNAGTFALHDVEYLTTAPTEALAELTSSRSRFTLAPRASVTFSANAGLTGAANSTGSADTTYSPASGQMTSSSALMGVCILNNRTTLATPSFQSELGSQATSPTGYIIDPLTGTTLATATLTTLGASTTADISASRLSRQLKAGSGYRDSHRRHSAHTFRRHSYRPRLSPLPNSSCWQLVLPLRAKQCRGAVRQYRAPGYRGWGRPGAGETTAQVQADEALFTAALHAMGASAGKAKMKRSL